ncbi:MAG: AAA-like domain-containing protein, partial [Pseudomonadota bacterium]|nr:AAA-like domain-containing protein [Pseudomonadota bacterium]
MTDAPQPLRLQAGGAVNWRTSVYVIRPSDDQLLALLEQGEYCNVLCSRQMGKTSLLKRTRARLKEKGVKTAEIDVAGALGTPDADGWYQGLLQQIALDLELEVDVAAWWRASPAITANQRLIRFFRQEVAQRCDGRVVIFLDEIDSTLKLPYTDDFFVAIRSMYNDRAADPVYEKIAFCLVGVATPNELIKDRRTTSYNIGRTIELRDFDPAQDDLRPLYDGLAQQGLSGEALLPRILYWSGGHPYLTLWLCEQCAGRGCSNADDVDQLITETYRNLDAVRNDTHFQQILRFLGERAADQLATLELYRRIRQCRKVPDQAALPHTELKLAGIVKRDRKGMLVVRNAIYQRIFTAAWAKAAMPAVEQRVEDARLQAMVEAQIATLSRVIDDYPLAREAYERLRAIPAFAGKADQLWAEFWNRRARQAAVLGKRDRA